MEPSCLVSGPNGMKNFYCLLPSSCVHMFLFSVIPVGCVIYLSYYYRPVFESNNEHVSSLNLKHVSITLRDIRLKV